MPDSDYCYAKWSSLSRIKCLQRDLLIPQALTEIIQQQTQLLQLSVKSLGKKKLQSTAESTNQ